MIDPTNTEPIPVHTPHVRRVLSALAVILLLVAAVALVLQEVDFTDRDISPEVVPLPTATEENEITLIQEEANAGTISREEAERQIQERFNQIPTPPPPGN